MLIFSAFFLCAILGRPTATALRPSRHASTLMNAAIDTTLFTLIDAKLIGVFESAGAWGDYDNDGDLDILLAGLTGLAASDSAIAVIYRNNGSQAFELAAHLFTVQPAAPRSKISAAWGDYDHDDDLDVLLAGFGMAKVYRNDDGVFIDSNAELSGVNHGSASWGDYDNDGDLDILLAGESDNFPIAKIYQNDGGSFTEAFVFPVGFSFSSTSWGDYDNDGDLDILICGSTGAKPLSQIFRNEGGYFAEADTLLGVSAGSAAWGDYDHDGDLDVFLAGLTEDAHPIAKLYKNDAGNFSETDSLAEGLANSSAAWGDFDNDGKLDLLVAGNTRAQTLTQIYRNVSANHRPVFALADSLAGANFGAVAWGDEDNDGDLDILLAGLSRGPATKIYRNNAKKANTLPAAPANLSADISRDSVVVLSWDQAADGETPPASLTYNLRVGATPSGQEIMAPMAEATTGYRRLPQFGNATHANFRWFVGLPEGLYYWSVQALDQAFAGSEFAPEASFVVDYQAPKILSVNAPATADLGTAIFVSANVTDNIAVQEVWLLYREGGRVVYDSTAMAFNANQLVYQAAIPKAVAKIRGVEFNIAAGDVAYNRKTLGWRSVQIKLRDRDLRKNHLGGSAQDAYRLISVPLASDDPAVNSILLPDLGAPDTTEWRMWAINPSRATSLFPYIEYPAVGNLAAGKAKFLITLENKTLTSGAGVTVKTTEPFAIPLQEGWNMIASPFNFAIPRQNIKPQELQASLYAYHGSWQAAPDSLRPWEGYMIKAPAQTTLTILPSESIFNPPSEIAKTAIGTGWQIRLTAACERARDHDNYLGVANDAAMEWDPHERFEPPPIGEFVMLAFPHRDWKRNADVYTTDFHPPSAEGQIWNFTVDTNISGKPVTLRFDDLASVPDEFEARLVDVSLQLSQNLRREPKYVYRSANNGGKKVFRLLIGKSSFMVEHGAAVAAIPATYELAQNFPNPFNSSTSIKFGLPEKSRITLKIYNLLGKEVATVLDNVEREAGYHATVWEGTDRNGEAMPSGIYLYRLEMSGTILIKKMTLIK
ncbi:MAG: T9SS type A sorting domain-containing protein [candidate division KSB1 bacterium]|nr:T9SS type A sorting domain-containing protein [candidate division KSB1 bacterium]